MSKDLARALWKARTEGGLVTVAQGLEGRLGGDCIVDFRDRRERVQDIVNSAQRRDHRIGDRH